jgi:hypothetical protein
LQFRAHQIVDQQQGGLVLATITVPTQWRVTSRVQWTYSDVSHPVRAIIRANGKDSRVARAMGSDTKGRLSLVLYAAGTGLAFAAPVAAYVAYVVVALMWFVPDRRLAPETT